MAGTSRADGIPPGWISAEEFQSDLARLGCNATPKQLSNWRAAGLIPAVEQRSVLREGRVWGSTTWHSPIEARRALAVERALASKDLLDYAGTVMWLAGANLDERYWRPQLKRADATLLKVRRGLRLLARERDDDLSTLGERMVTLGNLTGAFAKMARRLPPKQAAAAVNVGLSVATGQFEGFDTRAPDEGELPDIRLVERAMDLSAARTDGVNGARLNLIDGLSAVFVDIASAIDAFSLADFSDEEIEAARNDVRNGFKFVVCFYDAMSWIYGKEAFGLRMASALGRHASVEIYFAWIAIFIRLRRRSNGILPSSEITNLGFEAERIWLTASYFRELQLDPKLNKIIQPKRWKLAFSDSLEYGNLIKDLAGYEFPMPEFRPWDQWNKLCGKTMPIGLLAMSIGAPPKRDLADILPNASGGANP